MCEHIRAAMREGALGLGAALIYMPDAYADTAELKALACAAAELGGGYAVHLRSETRRLLEALDEDRPRDRHPHGDLSPQGRRAGELACAPPWRWSGSKPRAARGWT